MSDPSEIAVTFQSDWKRWHGGALPLAHLLRDAGTPWIRFHALPQSKRYPDSEGEYKTVLMRGNTLAGALLGQDVECWAVQSVYPGADLPSALSAIEALAPAMRFCPGEDGEEWQAYVSPTTWKPSRFDTVLREIADDELDYALWMNRGDGAIFAPYDGGFDLFPATQTEVEKLRQVFRDWLPGNPQGL